MKVYRLIISIALLIGALSIGYYYVIRKPEIDRERLQQEQAAVENDRKVQEEAEYQKWINELRKECESDREKAAQQVKNLANSCQTEECINNVANGSLNDITPGSDFVSNCIDRKILEVQNKL